MARMRGAHAQADPGVADLSPFHLARLFQQEVGMRLVGVPPGRYADDRKNVHYGAC